MRAGRCGLAPEKTPPRGSLPSLARARGASSPVERVEHLCIGLHVELACEVAIALQQGVEVGAHERLWMGGSGRRKRDEAAVFAGDAQRAVVEQDRGEKGFAGDRDAA